MMGKPKLILIGGFLGAGKTTLLSMAAHFLQSQAKKVGLITNDQAAGLVDTQILEFGGFNVEEVSGSCFCCDFNGFHNAINNLLEDFKCEVILAEPVGSCTDLYATLIRPLQSMFSEQLDVAPLFVLVDPFKLLKTMNENGTEAGPGYIYLKQLEEADHLIINKIDLLKAEDKRTIQELLETQFSAHPVHWISAKKGAGVEKLSTETFLDSDTYRNALTKVDYNTYAIGEAQMGWYNATFMVESTENKQVDWMQFNQMFLTVFQQVFNYEKIDLNHLKIFMKNGSSHVMGNIIDAREISVRGEYFCSKSTRMVLNIRAETSHQLIYEIVRDVVEMFEDHSLKFKVVTEKHLTPGYPNPTYRFNETTT